MHMRTRWRIGSFILMTAALGLTGMAVAHPVRAQTMHVTIKSFSFQPANLIVPVGTTVTWTNQDSVDHTSTSDTSAWDSGHLGTGQSFSFTFKQPGTFPYHCMIHPYMKGTIVVQAAAKATAAPAATATTMPTSVPLSAYPSPGSRATFALHMGPTVMVRRPAWLGFYDGHKDTYLSTDVSDKAQARAMHINFAPVLRRMPMGAMPAIYLVQGRAVGNQLAVFGSEPGETSYSPLWNEVIVHWKPHVRPVLLIRDDQILELAKKGKLIVRHTHIMLNCPIIKVGR